MFSEATTQAFDVWTEPPKDNNASIDLWRDYWIAIGMLIAVEEMLKLSAKQGEE